MFLYKNIYPMSVINFPVGPEAGTPARTGSGIRIAGPNPSRGVSELVLRTPVAGCPITGIAHTQMAAYPSAKHRLVLGPKANGQPAYDYFRPSLLGFASKMVMAVYARDSAAMVPWGDSIPLADGMSSCRRSAEKQAPLSLMDTQALRFRRVYGYVAEIKYHPEETKDVITFETPAAATAVLKLWWRYGNLTAEAHDSWLYCRILACTSTAAFEGQFELFNDGGPISGIPEATNGARQTAQLTGWGPVSAAEWKLRSPSTFIDDGFELDGDALAFLPSVAKDNFAHFHLPNAAYARMSGSLAPKYMTYPAGPPAPSDAKGGRMRGRSATPRNSAGRRMRDRNYAKADGKKSSMLSAQEKPARVKAPPTRLFPYRVVWRLL